MLEHYLAACRADKHGRLAAVIDLRGMGGNAGGMVGIRLLLVAAGRQAGRQAGHMGPVRQQVEH